MKASVAPTVSDLAVERALAKVAESFRFVLDLTPVDVIEQRKAFLAGEVTEPVFTYRELEDAPAVLESELAAIHLEDVDDPALRELLAARHRELQLQVKMLSARESKDFVQLSAELYGPIGDDVVREAETILAKVPAPAGQPEECVRADRFAELAEHELDHYRAIEPDLGVHVDIRPDVAGVMVSGSVLFVSSATRIPASRVHALLQHEVGTHLVTYANGRFQPIGMMASGLAGYEQTQEGLAVLAEFLAGGLSSFRLRQLAVRVVAVGRMLAGGSFSDVNRAIIEYGFSRNSAFTTTMRVFRSGGLTKDAIYLRGLLNVLAHLREGRDLEALWIGKLSLEQLHLVQDLLERGMLVGARLRPRFLDFPATKARLYKATVLPGVTGLMGDSR